MTEYLNNTQRFSLSYDVALGDPLPFFDRTLEVLKNLITPNVKSHATESQKKKIKKIHFYRGKQAVLSIVEVLLASLDRIRNLFELLLLSRENQGSPDFLLLLLLMMLSSLSSKKEIARTMRKNI